MERGNYPYALQELLAAEKLDPRNPLIHNNLALVYYVRERTDLSEKHFREALRLEPAYSDARNNFARTLIDQKRYDEAKGLLDTVLKDLTYAGGDRAWLNLGIIHFEQKNWSEARRAFEQSLVLQRESCLASSYHGRTLFEEKRYRQAARGLDQAIAFCQREMFDEPHYYSALAWYRAGDRARAKARFQEILKLYPNGRYRDRAQGMLQILEKGTL